MKAACGFLFVVCLSFGCGTQMKLVSSKPPEFPPTGEAPLSIHSYGEFRLAGYHAWTNGMTLKDGIAVAGGLTDFAGRRINCDIWMDPKSATGWGGTCVLQSTPS